MYVSRSELTAAVPADLAGQLLGAGGDATWTTIEAAVSRAIDGRLAARYAVPLPEPVPAIVRDAALVLAAEALYQQAGYFDAVNPWTKRAECIRGTVGQQGGQEGLLDRLAAGNPPLYAAAVQAPKRSAAAITEPAVTTSARGNRLC